MKDKISSAKFYIAPLIILTVIYFFGIRDINAVAEHHFDFITVNSIFGGFLFSGLSTILDLGSNKTIKQLVKMGSMDKIYSYITEGITCSIVSICFSLIGSFVSFNGTKLENIQNKFDYVVVTIEIYFLIVTILLFLASARYIKLIVKESTKEIKSTYKEGNILERI